MKWIVAIEYSRNGKVICSIGKTLPYPDILQPGTIKRVIRRESAASRLLAYLEKQQQKYGWPGTFRMVKTIVKE